MIYYKFYLNKTILFFLMDFRLEIKKGKLNLVPIKKITPLDMKSELLNDKKRKKKNNGFNSRSPETFEPKKAANSTAKTTT